MRRDEDEKSIGGWIVLGVSAALVLFCCGLYGCPRYNVWQQGLEGEAELARAAQNRKIKTLEAEAKKDSAKLDAEAEQFRASGLAQANKILGESLAGEQGERYLRYLWITGLEKGDNRETVYIPTEAGLPILEAGRLHSKTQQTEPVKDKK